MPKIRYYPVTKATITPWIVFMWWMVTAFGKLSDMAVSYEMLCRKNDEYVQILKNY